MFRKVLVANRGEIALRVIRTLREMGIASVAVYSEADVDARHTLAADEAVLIGPAQAARSYLNTQAILDAARSTGAEAIHPGYGFLSENAGFAQSCADAGLVFIGPSPEAILAMGGKIASRQLAVAAGMPVVPGSGGAVSDSAEALRIGQEHGYPLMIKASAGGGGIGMRIAWTAADLEKHLADAGRDAERFFGSADVFVERYLKAPRHIEVQVLGDQHGNLVHLGERECTIQRRHQKLLEESPSLALPPALRAEVCGLALKLASAIGYTSAGTVEFLYDGAGQFYFLEMNTRLQVEHPVTEAITGLDLVREQVRIAAGEPLGYAQSDIVFRGHAIECRINAEDPGKNFLPSIGVIDPLREPAGPGVRVDSAIYPGYRVPVYYDSLLAKLVIWDQSRPLAIRRLRRALHEFELEGIQTTLSFFRCVVEDPSFQAGELDTGYAARLLATGSGAREAKTGT